MKVSDLNGCLIEVTDLDEAIKVTTEYKEYEHEDKNDSDFDRRQKAYWTDMHQKLMELKKK
ncbi:hypothetical protein [Flavobacterium eburneipallidum]|uniref:hypothetical protein n=1 Tax=Flavobacterium eburneipallidum TaxID=3003263 RepID=UPI002482A7F1|nr:hypothetical protein [Flavobacterium eburneipallidum]